MILQEEDVIKKEFLRYKNLLSQSEGLFSFEKKEKVKIGDLRILGIFPPVYFLVVEKVSLPLSEKALYKVIPLSEEIALSHLNKNTPFFIFKTKNLCLCALPFWLYFAEEFIFNYSKKIATADKKTIKKCIKYTENTLIPKNYQGKYIKKEKERLSQYAVKNFSEIVKLPEEIEIALPPQVAEEVKKEYSYLKAASGKNVFKGKNWYGILEKRPSEGYSLFLYVPFEFIGKKVIISLKDKIIFKDKLETDTIIIRNLPSLPDYSFLEEELNVQIREI